MGNHSPIPLSFLPPAVILDQMIFNLPGPNSLPARGFCGGPRGVFGPVWLACSLLLRRRGAALQARICGCGLALEPQAFVNRSPCGRWPRHKVVESGDPMSDIAFVQDLAGRLRENIAPVIVGKASPSINFWWPSSAKAMFCWTTCPASARRPSPRPSPPLLPQLPAHPVHTRSSTLRISSGVRYTTARRTILNTAPARSGRCCPRRRDQPGGPSHTERVAGGDGRAPCYSRWRQPPAALPVLPDGNPESGRVGLAHSRYPRRRWTAS